MFCSIECLTRSDCFEVSALTSCLHMLLNLQPQWFSFFHLSIQKHVFVKLCGPNLCAGCRGTKESLVLHVHPWPDQFRPTSESSACIHTLFRLSHGPNGHQCDIFKKKISLHSPPQVKVSDPLTHTKFHLFWENKRPSLAEQTLSWVWELPSTSVLQNLVWLPVTYYF